ncbi:FGGY family carbohydrate kinase [Catenovulum sp. 2E275]|uniref:FGGY-family carbohydrate kinase n=1 Tax=Catenovulum sp. 2E275 TaxID=2980497 RepID=UPI0021D37819|nr:FGGY family carbohydrate kinase [Catenovulum sp. 2E275]MCU4674149.1 FGGY family carbohydrate kinase [Catenovulum sp. 2E275]
MTTLVSDGALPPMYTFIFDIGKTNIKGNVLNDQGETVWSESALNQSIQGPDYTYIDVENVETWLLSCLKKAADQFDINAINITTHGACAVLLDSSGKLALPVMDYECEVVESCNQAYNQIRPDFNQTLSPNLSAGLNLGRQLFWLKQHFAEQFSQVQAVLMYPQYWVWRLTGKLVNEVTSLGCHTDLWQPEIADYSSLVDTLNIRHALPALVNADEVVGKVTPQVANQTGLNTNCQVYAGIHDSNSSFSRYLGQNNGKPFTVVSTGTWVISMAMGADIHALKEEKDMLANVCVLNQPIACARFMGGREFSQICEQTGAKTSDPISAEDLQTIVNDKIFALPAFSAGSGPFVGKQSKITAQPHNGNALATLYLALMIDHELTLLNAKGDIIFGSTSKKNPLMCRLIAQLRPEQNVVLSGDSASTVKGAWVMTKWQQWQDQPQTNIEIAEPAGIENLEDYKALWLAAAQA